MKTISFDIHLSEISQADCTSTVRMIHVLFTVSWSEDILLLEEEAADSSLMHCAVNYLIWETYMITIPAGLAAVAGRIHCWDWERIDIINSPCRSSNCLTTHCQGNSIRRLDRNKINSHWLSYQYKPYKRDLTNSYTEKYLE